MMKPKVGDLVRRTTGSRIDEVGLVLEFICKDQERSIVNPQDHCHIMWSSGEIFWHEFKWIAIL